MARKQADKATTIWQALDAWAKTLEGWQQRIIAGAVDHRTLTAEEIKKVYAELLNPGEEKVEVSAPDRPASADAPLLLHKIDTLIGVNALRDDASLTFGRGLTVIFGRNGVGKSGFVRVISNACFCRNTPDIVPNIYKDDTPTVSSARFYAQLGNSAATPIDYPGGADHAVLKRIAVFDSSVAKEVLSQPSAFEFRPRGFDVFTEMVRVYGELTHLLDEDLASRNTATDFSTSFIAPVTDVSTAVSQITADTDMDALKALGVYGDVERARLKQLDEQLTALKARSPKAVLELLREAKGDIEGLIAKLRTAGAEFSDTAQTTRQQLVTAARDAAAAALLVGSDTFKRPFFNAVGTPEWEQFAKAAHALSRKEGVEYPKIGDRCLLCEQPLQDEAQGHISSLLTFVEGDAQHKAESTKSALDKEIQRLNGIQLPDFSNDSRVRTHLHRIDPATEAAVAKVRADMDSRREEAKSALEARRDCAGSVHVEPVVVQLEGVIERLAADIVRLEADDVEAAIAAVELERQTLRHREVLSQLLPQIEIHVKNLAWARKATLWRASLNTRHITEKEKELFNRFVTDAYRKRFGEECEALDCTLPVELRTMGRSGQTVRALAMPKGHKPNDILSEGEQKAVALADFLTEAGLNPNNAGIVLDDPVTSQDHQRKFKIAVRLVEEAKKRQVIVFTHDLVFLNQLLVGVEESSVELTTHWVQLDGEGTPGSVALGDTPYTDKTHRSTERAKECLAAAKKLAGRAQSDLIVQGMDALRTTLEVTVANRVLKGIVTRWDEHIKVPSLRKVNWDNAKAEELVTLYEEISRYIGAHSHSDEASGAPPEPKDLEAKISAVDALIKWATPERK